MNTLDITSEIGELVGQGRRRAQELEQAAEQRAEDEWQARRAELAEKWEPLLVRARAALPEWVHPFLTAPDDMEPEVYSHSLDDRLCHPMTLALPGLAPIHVYIDRNQAVRFDVPEATQYHAAEEVGWYVRYRWAEFATSRWGTVQLGDDLSVAAAMAQEQAAALARLEQEAVRRNQEAAAQARLSKSEPEPVSPLQSARCWLSDWQRVDAEAAFGDNLGRVLMAALVSATIAQAEAITRLAEVTETLLEAGQAERSARIWGS